MLKFPRAVGGNRTTPNRTTPDRTTPNRVPLNRTLVAGSLLLSLVSGIAVAQEPQRPPPEQPTTPQADDSETKSPDVAEPEAPRSQERLPKLAYAPAPTFPSGALEAGTVVDVNLELLISAEGLVEEAKVQTPVGGGFDEAALLAARASRFEPATNARGQAVEARIIYRLRFEPKAAPAKVLRGLVREAGVRLPMPNFELELTSASGERVLLQTDSEGRFEAAGLAPGAWILVGRGPGLLTLTEGFEVVPGKITELEVYIVRDRAETARYDEEVVIKDTGPRSEITERRLSAEEIRYLPGSNGDVVKVVQNLPGIARSPLGVGQLIIRGTNPEDSRFFVDGSPVPLVFHFGGLTSVIPGDALEEVAYLPGNFSVRYGRIIGGLVDLRTNDTLPERSRGYFSVDVYQSALWVEQKVGDNTAIMAGVRRSYIDAVLGPILNNQDGLTVQAPRYWDGQFRVLHKTDAGVLYDGLVLFSDDQFRFLGGDEGEEQQTLASFSDQFARLRMRRLSEEPGGWRHETTFGIGPDSRSFEFGNAGDAEEKRLSGSLREEWSLPLTQARGVGLRVGLDLQAGHDSYLFYFANTGPREEGDSPYFAPALYAETPIGIGPLTLTPGIRGDLLWFSDVDVTVQSVDPRGSALLRLTERTRLKAAVGKMSGMPSLRQVSPEADGTPGLTSPWSLQSSMGIEHSFGSRLSGEFSGFYNSLQDLVVGREDRLRFFTGPPPVGPFDTGAYANEGVGMVCGVEGLLRYTSPTSVGLLTVTLSHSERQDRVDEPEELFTYDQPVVFNALWSQELRKNLRLGGRFRGGSGNPYTPVVNRYFDAGTQTYSPVYGERSSERLPFFYALDLRIDKSWILRKWELSAYLDVQNIALRTNSELIQWNYDYTKEVPLTSNPPLPVFGFRGEW